MTLKDWEQAALDRAAERRGPVPPGGEELPPYMLANTEAEFERVRDAAGRRLRAEAVQIELRDTLRIHHPIMRSETGPFSGCRCGQVGLGQDVIAHVVGELRAAMEAEGRRRAELVWLRLREAHDWQCDCDSDDPCRIRIALTGARAAALAPENARPE